jgi:glycosyltransferase involved in cell wall biosynthesis
MHPSPRSIPVIHLGWQITPWTGWGRYGLNLARELQQCGYAVVVDGVAESRHLSAAEQQSLAGMTIVSERSSDAPPIPVAVSLQSFGNRGSCSPRSPAIQAERRVGVIFSEDTRWQPDEVARLNECEAVIAGSSWNAAVLRAAGVHNVATILQGIAADLWCQTAPDPGFAERLAGHYLVFSGGKLEFRKGQDIVVAAFRRFHRQHPDAVLVTAWQNPWPQTMLGLGLAGYVHGLPQVVKGPAGDALDLHAWAAAQGIESGAFVDLGLLAGHELPRFVKACDMAVFANRAEGGTNLVAMECIAAGLPTVLSGNTGHLDLVDSATMLSNQGRVPEGCPFYRETTGWGETSVDDLVAAMEQGYARRHAAPGSRAAIEARGREFAERFSWAENARRLLSLLNLPENAVAGGQAVP